MSRIDAEFAHFIKLGKKGIWETECLENSTLRLAYVETPEAICRDRDWKAVQEFWFNKRSKEPNNTNKDPSTIKKVATSDARQIRVFYEAKENAIFIAFHDGRMFWCQPTGEVERLDDGSHSRKTLHGWSDRSIGGNHLTSDRLSGALLKVQGYQGTICDVKPFDYLIRKLNDETLPAVARAEKAETELKLAIIELMRLLTWKDFETLVDLVFSSSGWRRVSEVGGSAKTLDIELMLPTTDERAFVQVKSKTDASQLQDYLNRFEQSELYDRMFFVWHTGAVDTDIDGVTLIPPERLADMVMAAGLASWLREKVSK